MRTYSMLQDDGRRERWVDTTARVSEGHFALLKRRALEADAWWSDEKAQRMMLESATRQFQFKWTPAGRGLQFMGSRTMEVKGGAVGMSCAFTSTKNLASNFPGPFCRMFDLLMLGVGVGFDDKGKGSVVVHWNGDSEEEHVIEDTREGWTEALRLLLLAFDPRSGSKLPRFNFSKIRPKGTPLKLMGGLASGPAPLVRMLTFITRALSLNNGKPITAATICDVMNMIGACVVSGGVRRSSQIFLGQATEEFLGLKDQSELQALRAGPMSEEVLSKIAQHPMTTHRWASNNSVFAHFGMDYSEAAERIAHNGEPGLIWLDDMVRPFGRIADGPDWKDKEAEGVNPCSEQALFSEECCLVGSTRILTDRGYRPIEELVGSDVQVAVRYASDEDFSELPRFAPASVFPTGEKQVMTITTVDGRRLTCTTNHPLLVSEEGELLWIKAGELSEGDVLVSGGVSVEQAAPKLDDTYYALGHYTGDGWFLESHNGRGAMGFCAGGHERDLIEKLVPVWERLLTEAECEIKSPYDNRYDRPLSVRTDSNGVLFVTMTKPHLFRHLQTKYGFVAAKAPQKRLPGCYWTATPDQKRSFLRGLFDADGSVVISARRSLSLTAANDEFARDVMLALSEFGIEARMTTHYIEARDRSQTSLNVRGFENMQRAAFHVMFQDEHHRSGKAAKLHDALSSLYGRKHKPLSRECAIRSIEMGDVEPVYNLEVPDGHHYTAEGIVVHNCNLAELYMTNHESLEDWLATIKSAFLYGKAMTLADIHDPEVDAVCKKNRRIGLSITGVAAMYDRLGHRELRRWLDAGYKEVIRLDTLYSGWLDIPLSIKHTSLKPSGSVSTLPGVQGGIRFPEDLHYMRLVRFSDTDPLWQRYEAAGYKVEDDVAVQHTKVVYFPVEEKGFRRTIKDVSLREQLGLGALVQKHWSDNLVSATYMVKPEERGQIKPLIEEFEGCFKSMSFLPVQEKGSYPQMPYTTCTREEFEKAKSKCSPVYYHEDEGQSETQRFCDGDVCMSPSS